jgi:hypothetical protein
MSILKQGILAVVFAAQTLFPSDAKADPDDNLQVMLRAARQLKFSLPENKAFMLEKQGYVVSEVAVIFGYVDNAAACEALALTLSTSGTDGTFKCHPIY